MAKSRSMPSLRNKVGSEENFNSSLHSKLQVQNGHHVTLQMNAFQNKRKLELFIECTDLVQLDTFSRTDPMCVLYVKRLGQWMEYGRTESIPNSLHPKVCPLVLETVPCTTCINLKQFINFCSKYYLNEDVLKSSVWGNSHVKTKILSCSNIILFYITRTDGITIQHDSFLTEKKFVLICLLQPFEYLSGTCLEIYVYIFFSQKGRVVLKECWRQVRCSVKEKRPEKKCLKHKTILLNDNAKHYIEKKNNK